MNPLYKKIAVVATSLYAGTIFGNMFYQTTEMAVGSRESKKQFYGPNLSQQWADYAETRKERILDWNVLIPLSSFWDNPDRPIRFKPAPDLEGIELKIDVEKKK
jgi:hypothetical protein